MHVPSLLGSSSVEAFPGTVGGLCVLDPPQGCADTNQVGHRDDVGFLSKILVCLPKRTAQTVLGCGRLILGLQCWVWSFWEILDDLWVLAHDCMMGFAPSPSEALPHSLFHCCHSDMW